MNPVEDTYSIITIQNLDDEDFEFSYNKQPYLIRAQEVRRFPKFLALHAVKHLIDKLLNKKDIKTNNQDERDKLAAKIVLEEENLTAPHVKGFNEEVAERVEDMNKPSDLERILKKKREEEAIPEGVTGSTTTTEIEQEEQPIKPQAPATGEEEHFEGLEEKDKKTPIDEATQEERMPIKALPTKAELLRYAEKSMGMTMDEKTTKRFNKMTVRELIDELKYPLEGEED